MRSIPAGALTQLAQKHGNEPITIIEVDWTVDRTSIYADRDLATIAGRIVEVGDLDNVINVSNTGGSQEVSITLDDTGGTIKAIFDSHDIHKRSARVYQYFDGLNLADKFLLFSGVVTSPITWNERDRTVSFTILSQLEDKEIGFSAEEGQFPYLPSDMVGKPWPMIFGKVMNCPTLQINKAVTGTTLTGVGVLSGLDLWATLPDGGDDSQYFLSLLMIVVQIAHLRKAQACWEYKVAGEDHNSDQGKIDAKTLADVNAQIASLQSQLIEAASKRGRQLACVLARRQEQIDAANAQGLGANPINILGGEDFPQNQSITIDIGGGLFTGRFVGNLFYISSRSHPANDTTAATVYAEKTAEPAICTEASQRSFYRYETEVPDGCGDTGWPDTRKGKWIIDAGVVTTTTSAMVNEMDTEPIAQQFWAEPGATVKVHSDEPITYIVSIVPGSVLAVKAYKQLTGERRLVDVPTDLYAVTTQTYGTITAVQITVAQPLSSIVDQGWSDDLYVTFESTVGPNIVDILKHIIDTYTDLDWDKSVGEGGQGTFDHVKTKLIPFPANFPILERKNAIDVLQEIAFQARCAIWISNGIFYLKYLPEEPSSVDTITVSDIDADEGIQVELTGTEDIVTKMTVKWRMSWADLSDQEKDKAEKTMILRHNVNKYGIQAQEYDFYIYNQPDIVYKCATFWLIRKSNTWKRIKFKTFLNKLNLETLDAVTLDFDSPYVASTDVLATVEKATYNSADNCIDIECLVPVRAGTMTKYRFYWPAALAPTDTWPPADEITAGNAGGGGIGAGATGTLPIGSTSTITGGDAVFVGGTNVVFKSQSDRGDKKPTDSGFTAQTVVDTTTYVNLSPGSRPRLNLRVYGRRGMPPIPQIKPASPGSTGIDEIDINTTKFVDNTGTEKKTAYLSSIIYGINADDNLTIDRSALVADSTHEEGQPLSDVLKNADDYLAIRTDVSIWDQTYGEHEFDFAYDLEYEVYGAGTAFLAEI